MVRVVVFSVSIYPNEQELSKGMPGKEDRNLTRGERQMEMIVMVLKGICSLT